MKLPAITFFALLKKAERLRRHREAHHLIDLCHVTAIANDDSRDYFKAVVEYFRARIDDTLPERPKKAPLKPDDPFVLATMKQNFAQYRKAIGHG